MKAVIPRDRSDGSTVAKTMKYADSGALEIHVFCPLRTYSSPSRTARVCRLAESDPTSGSVTATLVMGGTPSVNIVTHRFFCSAEPRCRIGSEKKALEVRKLAMPISP